MLKETPTERRLRELGETEKECQLSAQLTLATNDGLDDMTCRHYHDYADERGRTAAAIDKGRQAIALLRKWNTVFGDPLAEALTRRESIALLAACQEDEG